MAQFKTAQPHPEAPDLMEVQPAEVWQNRLQLTLVDVRRPDEYVGELGHVEGAHLIVLDDLEAQWNHIPTGKPIVFICRSGGRSARATLFAMEQGLKPVYNMKGGMLAWNEQGLTVVRTPPA